MTADDRAASGSCSSVNAKRIDLFALDDRTPDRLGARSARTSRRSSLAFSSRPNATFHPSFAPSRGVELLTDSTIARSVSVASSGTPRSSSPESLASRRRARTSGAVACPSRSSALVNPNRQRTADVARPAVQVKQHEPDAAMDGKDREAIVESGDLVDLSAIEEVTSQRRSAGVADETRRHDEADATARPDELQRTLDKELIEVDVRPALDAIDAGLDERTASAAAPRDVCRPWSRRCRCHREPCPMAGCR